MPRLNRNCCTRPSARIVSNWTVLAGKGPTAGVALTPEEFERARDAYYRLAGCDPATGYATREKLAELGLEWVTEKK